MAESDFAITPRRQCYHDIRQLVSHEVTEYYRKNPQRLQEPDTETKIAALIALMQKILKILDQYEISALPPGAESETSTHDKDEK